MKKIIYRLLLCIFFHVVFYKAMYAKSPSKKESYINKVTKEIDENPYDKGSYFFRGLLYLSDNKFDKAIKDFEKSLPEYANLVEIYLAEAYLGSNNIENALLYSEKAVKRKPYKLDNYVTRGICFDILGGKQKAINDYLTFLNLEYKKSLKNKLFVSNFRLGMLYFQLGKYNKSLFYINKALLLEQENYDLLFMMFAVYLKLGNHNGAKRYFILALENGFNDKKFYENMMNEESHSIKERFNELFSNHRNKNDTINEFRLNKKSYIIDSYFRKEQES